MPSDKPGCLENLENGSKQDADPCTYNNIPALQFTLPDHPESTTQEIDKDQIEGKMPQLIKGKQLNKAELSQHFSW